MNVEVGGEGGEKENSGVRAYRKNTVVTSKECKLWKQESHNPNQNLNAQNWQHKTSFLTCIVAVWTPPENCAKEFRKQIYSKSKHTHTEQTSGNYFGLQTRVNLMFKQSDKINHLETAWPSVLFYLIDYNVVLVSCCTSKSTNKTNIYI